METIYKSKIEEICNHFGWRKVDLIEKLETTRATLGNVENAKFGKPSVEFLNKIETKLGISKNWFLGESEIMLIQDQKSTAPALWEDLKRQYEKRIADLEFIVNIYKSEKMKEPAFANFTKLSTKEAVVIPFTGAAIGVGQALTPVKVANNV